MSVNTPLSPDDSGDLSQEGERLYRGLIEISPDAVFITCNSRIVFINPATLKFFGTDDPAQILGKALQEFVHPDSLEQAEQRLAAISKTFNPLPRAEESWVRVDGTRIEVEVAAVALRWQGQPAIQVVARDITERKRLENELRRALDEMDARVRERTQELTTLNAKLKQEVAERHRLEEARRGLLRRVVTSQEDERRRISRELHDQLGQNLAALMMGLKNMQALQSEATVQSRVNEQLHKLQSLTALLMEQVHLLAWELRPAALDNIGLEAALRQCVREWSETAAIPAEFLARGLHNSERLPWHVETAIYRAVQEALHNVQRHAMARHVSVLLERRNDTLIAIVEDDGNGFAHDGNGTPTDPAKRERLGLVGIRERLEQIGGEVEIESARGQGTTIFLRAPLERRNIPREERLKAEG